MQFLKEPLVHFLGLAAVIFWINANFGGDDRELISVDSATIDYLVQQEADLRLRELTQEERQDVFDQFVDDEILVREARKRGFDNSSRVRTLLIQNMRFFVKQDLPVASEDTLRAYYEQNLERFTRPPSVTLEQVYFQSQNTVPDGLLETLNNGADPAPFGDTALSVSRRVSRATPRDIASSFDRESAQQIVAIADERWHGPFNSNLGVHFLRVTERHPQWVPSFEESRMWLETQWVADQQLAAMDAALVDMRKNYRVEYLQSEEAE